MAFSGRSHVGEETPLSLSFSCVDRAVGHGNKNTSMETVVEGYVDSHMDEHAQFQLST